MLRCFILPSFAPLPCRDRLVYPPPSPGAVFFLLNWSLALPRAPANVSPARPALPPTHRDAVAACSYFLVFTSYFPLIPPSAFLILKSRATYAEAVSDRELALPRHAQLRRRFENPRASCARRHRARFPQRQNLPQRRWLPLLSHNCLWPAHSTPSELRRSKSALLCAQEIRRHLATRRRFHPRTRPQNRYRRHCARFLRRTLSRPPDAQQSGRQRWNCAREIRVAPRQ